jgi:hypothetical protein
VKLALVCTAPDDVPLRSSLGRVLKALLRRHGMRCLSIIDLPDAPGSPAASPTSPQTALDASECKKATKVPPDDSDAGKSTLTPQTAAEPRHRRQLPRELGRGEDDSQIHANERSVIGMASESVEATDAPACVLEALRGKRTEDESGRGTGTVNQDLCAFPRKPNTDVMNVSAVVHKA